MCLFTNNQSNTRCHHEECRQFYSIMKNSKQANLPNTTEMLGKRSSPSSMSASENEKSIEKSNVAHSKKALKLSYTDRQMPRRSRNNESKDNRLDNGHKNPNMAQNWMRIYMPQPFFNQVPSFNNHVHLNHQQPQIPKPPPQPHPQPQMPHEQQNGNLNQLDILRTFPMSLMLTEMRAQSQMIINMKERLDSLYKLLSFFIKDYQSSKFKMKKGSQELENFSDLIGKTPNDTLSSNDLLYYIKGTETEFPYRLELSASLEQPLVKERNFSIEVKLVNQSGEVINNSNKILLDVDVYSSDIPPINIKRSTSGKSIVKGNKNRVLINGCCDINKIQIKEVTSHYREGWIFLVILPSENNFNPVIQNEKYIDYKKIKPLILSNIVVKAKMPKKKKKKKNLKATKLTK